MRRRAANHAGNASRDDQDEFETITERIKRAAKELGVETDD